ncbi:invertase [Salmonella enterica subsp. enterica serovar Agona str. 400095 17]|nr:invertase [Salmonella enterica subsp. enterica serovar Agona str. 400095 17]
MADHICQKTGPSGVRAKLYVAALTASRWNKQAKAIYERLVAKGKAKKAALGAVMRKTGTFMLRRVENAASVG